MADDTIKTTKKAAKKKTAKKAPTTKKTTATVSKKAVAKKAVAKKATSRKVSKKKVAAATWVSSETRQKMIEEAAYYKAERRGFESGWEEQDWAESEREIDDLLKR